MSTWTAFIYTVHVTLFPRGSACVYIENVVKTSIRNYFAKPRRGCFELLHIDGHCFVLYAAILWLCSAEW